MIQSREDYMKHYAVEALFKLMEENEYENISVIDVCNKAGISRATFYRNFKKKEDVIIFYFEHNKSLFASSQNFIPRCKEDYKEIIKNVFEKLYGEKDRFKLLIKSHLEYIYLNYLNENFANLFQSKYYQHSKYASIGYAGMLYNISIDWVKNNCNDSVDEIVDCFLGLLFQGEYKK